MVTKTHTGSSAASNPAPMTAEWIYDTLMQEIEPDLTTKNILTLDQKYADESKEERMTRLGQYALAFMIFEECLQDLDIDMRAEAEMVRRDMLKAAMQEEEEKDAEVVKELEGELEESDFRA